MSFWQEKKVLVTGSCGFIGVNLLKRLVSTGASIRAVFHNKTPVLRDASIEYMQGDLTRAEDCSGAVAGMDYVFHCAASTSGAAVIERSPLTHVTPNIIMNALLLEAAYNARVGKFMWLGSSTGYPDGDHPFKEDEMMDGDPYEKYFCVGWMKRYTEVLCRMYAQKLKKTMPVIVLRPTNVYGPEDDFDFATSHVLPALIRKVVERHDPIEVWGTGEDVRDLIYVDDMIAAMLKAMEELEQYDVFNIGLGKGYRVKQILEMILEADGYNDARIVFDPSRPTTIPKRLVDISRAERVLGFKARTGLKEGIDKTVKWYRSRRAAPAPGRPGGRLPGGTFET